MLYFFHHYELPIILEQATLQDMLANRNPHATVRRGANRLELVIQNSRTEQSQPPAADTSPPSVADPIPDTETEPVEQAHES